MPAANKKSPRAEAQWILLFSFNFLDLLNSEGRLELHDEGTPAVPRYGVVSNGVDDGVIDR